MKAVVLATLTFASIISNASTILCQNGGYGMSATVVHDLAESCSSNLIIEVDGLRTCLVDDEARLVTRPGDYQVCGEFSPLGFQVLEAQGGELR